MLRWAIFFLVLGLIAGALGFGGIAGASFAIAKFLCFLFLAVCLLLFVLAVTAVRRLSGQ